MATKGQKQVLRTEKEKYDKEMEEKMGVYTKGLPGMF